MNSIIFLAYYIGIVSCAMQGAEKGKDDYYLPIYRYILNSFGGGLIRDCILTVHPWLFTRNALPDLILAILVGCIYTNFFSCNLNNKYKKIANTIIIITDSLSIWSFIIKGIDKASSCTNNIVIIIICGYITAIGGGILASNDSLVKVLQNTKAVAYHIVTVLCCCFYSLTNSEIGLAFASIISISLINTNIPNVYYYVFFLFNDYQLYLKISFYSKRNCNNIFIANKYYSDRICKQIQPPSTFPKRFLVLKRIRQC